MSLNAGFQLSLELTKAFPIRSVAESVGSKILAYARNARKSGSDIVVEADLAEVFGRGRIEYDIEQKFRKLVKIQGFSFLRDSCEVSLDSGVGPTILNALQDVRHFSTIIQLSFLGWTHEKTSLAAAIDQGMVKRFEMGVEGASASPGYEGILHTLEACSSQSSAFAWSDYTNLVDAKLRDSIPKYQYSTDLIRLSPAALTGAMDYLYLVQQLPESRKIMISNAMGSITFVVWAHYILGLNVIITTEASPAITFGDEQNPHILITWSELTPETHFLLPPATKDCGQMQPSIQLLDEDMSVMLESSPDPDHWTSIRADTRYPLRGYGSICLHRLFNANCITNDHDPIYKESVKLIVAIAIWVSKRVNRDMGIEKGIEYQSPQRTVAVEIWRILASAEVIFSGITWATDTTDIVDRVEYLSKSPLDAADLPKTCSQFFKKIPIKPLQQSPASCYIFHLRCLASMVFLFGFVAEIQSCSDVPLRELRLAEVGFEHQFLKACKNIEERLHLEHDTIFIQISLYLSDTVDLRNTLLHSEFGWSVYLDTFGDRDPAQIRPELVHIQKGVPTNRRTMERKSSIKDGSMELGPMRSSADDRSPPIRGRERHFRHAMCYRVDPKPEWRYYGFKPYQAYGFCGNMQRLLWQTYSTTACDHPLGELEKPVKLGIDAAAVMGWKNDPAKIEEISERFLICLTKGEPRIRWLALYSSVSLGRISPALYLNVCPEIQVRQVMLRTDDCCDSCALEQTAAVPRNHSWILIL